MFNKQTQAPGKQMAVAANTFTGAGSANLTPTLPGGAPGMPRRVRASGSVSGYVTISIGTQAQLVLLVNPNAPFTEIAIPPSAFPGPVNSVPVSVTAAGAGTITVVVVFD